MTRIADNNKDEVTNALRRLQGKTPSGRVFSSLENPVLEPSPPDVAALVQKFWAGELSPSERKKEKLRQAGLLPTKEQPRQKSYLMKIVAEYGDMDTDAALAVLKSNPAVWQKFQNASDVELIGKTEERAESDDDLRARLRSELAGLRIRCIPAPKWRGYYLADIHVLYAKGPMLDDMATLLGTYRRHPPPPLPAPEPTPEYARTAAIMQLQALSKRGTHPKIHGRMITALMIRTVNDGTFNMIVRELYETTKTHHPELLSAGS